MAVEVRASPEVRRAIVRPVYSQGDVDACKAIHLLDQHYNSTLQLGAVRRWLLRRLLGGFVDFPLATTDQENLRDQEHVYFIRKLPFSVGDPNCNL